MRKQKFTREEVEKIRPDLIEAGYFNLIPFIVDGTLSINHVGNLSRLLYNLRKNQIRSSYRYKNQVEEGVNEFKFNIKDFVKNNFDKKGRIKLGFSPDGDLFNFYRFLHEKKNIPYHSLLSESCD
jgi:hypothetical protein